MDIPVYSIAGQIISHVTVDEAAFGGRPNREVVRQALLMHEANQRVGTHQVKTKRTVAGSDRKVWAQKHTGRARHGNRSVPLWVGGGVAHGPSPRDYRQKLPRAARQLALCSAFLMKARDGQVLAVEGLTLAEPKTKQMAAVLRHLGVTRSFLIVLHESTPELWRCTRNIPGAAMLTYKDLNAYEVIRPDRVVFTTEAIGRFLQEAAVAPAAQGAEVAAVPQGPAGVSQDG
jgi:large subunit ribosomal protein L4